MKHYILVCVENPKADEFETPREWQSFVAKTLNIKDQSKGIQRLAENVWMLERKSAASSFAKIVSAAEGHGLKCVVHYLSSDE